MKKAKGIDKILIVDDEVEFVKSVRRHLKRRGFNPDFAFDGENACQKMLELEKKAQFYDLVIVDVVMPKMDGISLLTWIHVVFPKTSVLVVSGFRDLEYLKSKIRPGLDDFGRKPITPESMMELIGNISKKRIEWKEAADNSNGG